MNYALSLINNPKKLAQRLDEVNSALEETPSPSLLTTVAEEGSGNDGGDDGGVEEASSQPEKRAPRTAEI